VKNISSLPDSDPAKVSSPKAAFLPVSDAEC